MNVFCIRVKEYTCTYIQYVPIRVFTELPFSVLWGIRYFGGITFILPEFAEFSIYSAIRNSVSKFMNLLVHDCTCT